MTEYEEFLLRFSKLTEKHKSIVANTLSNIFTMRLLGNKTHGDLAEVGIAEFVNQFMYDYKGKHVGKDLFRAKQHEEDIVVTNEITKVDIPISLKAYGDGPLQLSTDKDSLLWAMLEANGESIDDEDDLSLILNSKCIRDIFSINVMPLIYRESDMECNIMVFDSKRALNDVSRIVLVKPGDESNGKGKGRTHPIYKFLNEAGEYICEVRYGNRTANALQRGLWTHTRNASQYFTSVTGGWIKYKHNYELISLIRLALNCDSKGHQEANDILQRHIEKINKNGEVK